LRVDHKAISGRSRARRHLQKCRAEVRARSIPSLARLHTCETRRQCGGFSLRSLNISEDRIVFWLMSAGPP
jgi:hypothetical protein